jgi:hypothetical protein
MATKLSNAGKIDFLFKINDHWMNLKTIMKKHALLIISLLALSLPFCGCNKAGKIGEKSEFKPPAGPMEFKLKWPQGERLEQSIDMKMQNDVKIPNQPQPMHQDITMDMGYEMNVLQANPDGTHEIEMDFLSARMQMVMGGKTMLDYDSAKKLEAGKRDPVGDVFSKMIGSKIRYYLDATNAVERVEGVDDMLNRMSTGPNAQQAAPMKSFFSEGYFKQMMNANLMLPQKPVQPGDTWTVQLEYPMGMMGTMAISYDFTFLNWEMHGKRTCAKLEFQGTVTTKKPDNPTPGQMSMTIQDGTTSGNSWFDPELGITIDTTANQNFKMVMQVPNPAAKGQAPKMQTIESDMQQQMSVKLVSVTMK